MPKPPNRSEDVFRYVAVGADNECWPWQAWITPKGYGMFRLNGKMRRAHRVVYEVRISPIPDGLQIDHLCRNRRCCNPSHLEPVTGKENVNRSPIYNGNKTHCAQGHEFSPENTVLKSGRRRCRTCHNESSRRRSRMFINQGLTARGTPRKRESR